MVHFYLKDRLHGRFDFVALQCDYLMVVFRQHSFIVRKIPRELACDQETFAKLEEEVIVVAGDDDGVE